MFSYLLPLPEKLLFWIEYRKETRLDLRQGLVDPGPAGAVTTEPVTQP